MTTNNKKGKYHYSRHYNLFGVWVCDYDGGNGTGEGEQEANNSDGIKADKQQENIKNEFNPEDICAIEVI